MSDSEILNLLSQGHSRQQATYIADCIERGQIDIEELLDVFYRGDMRLTQRSSFPLEMVAKKYDYILHPHLGRMIEELEKPNVINGVSRNTMRAWQWMSFPEEYEGVILEKAFERFSNPQELIATRVFAMTTCTNLAMEFPELALEIKTVIEDNWDHTTAAWRSRGRKELKRLEKAISAF